MPLEYPLLSNPISVDIQKLNEILEALTKFNPTEIDGISAGTKRLVDVSSGKWQWQEYNGSSWVAVPFLQHNVDQLDGYHAAITPAANTVAVRNASGLLEDSITGNAATASSAATLSQTLPVAKGGTGATTSEQARVNLGVPPTSHASTATTYGVGNATQYGHVKLSDAVDSASGATGGTAATPAAVKAAKDAADAAQASAEAATAKASTIATTSVPGIVKPGTGMTVDADGALNANTASTSKPGIVQLNNTVASTSSTQAATANAAKLAYDKGAEAKEAVESLQAEVSTILPFGQYSQKGTRSTTGNWTITSCVIGKPLIIITNGTPGGRAWYCFVSSVSGVVSNSSGAVGVQNVSNVGLIPKSNCLIFMPSSETVVLSVETISSGQIITAFN